MSGRPVARVYVRAPNHLGDVVMALPAIRRLTSRLEGADIDIWCPARWAAILTMAELDARVLPFERTRALWRTAGRIRGRQYDRGILFTPSLSTAIILCLARVPHRRGTATDGRRLLLTDATARVEEAGEHRASFYMRIADPGWEGGTPPAPRLKIPDDAVAQFRAIVGRELQGPVVGVFPSSRASARRWPADRFSTALSMLAGDVGTILVFGGPDETELSARVAAGAGSTGVDLGGRTDLRTLAAGFASCDVVVTNDTGPMHVAAAAGVPIVAIFGASDPARTGPLRVPSRIVRHEALPCAPCYRNECPRRGSGTFLPNAREECLQLVSVTAVTGAVRELLSRQEMTSGVRI